MKKLMCLALGVSLVGAMIVVAGCGGGGGIGAIIGVGLLIIALSASGGAAVAPFAASVKAQPVGYSLTASYTAIVTPTGRTAISTDTVYIDDATKKVLSFSNLQVEASTDGQYKVEIYPRNYTANTSPIFKYYFTETVPSGETVTTSESITATDTARALIYDRWAGSATMDIDQFSNQVPLASVTTVVTQILTDMGSLAPGKYTANFNWSGNTTTAAQNAANVTPSTPTYNNENMHGWWLLTPTTNEYAAFHYDNAGGIVTLSAFDAAPGMYSLQPDGRFSMDMTIEGQLVIATGSLTSMTTGNYYATAHHTGELVESGSFAKISDLSVCQGVWTGTYDSKTISATVNAYGAVTSLTIGAETWPNVGFMISRDGKAVIYAKTTLAETDSKNEMHLYGALSGSTFTGTIDFDGEGASTGPSDGSITLTKN